MFSVLLMSMGSNTESHYTAHYYIGTNLYFILGIVLFYKSLVYAEFILV